MATTAGASATSVITTASNVTLTTTMTTTTTNDSGDGDCHEGGLNATTNNSRRWTNELAKIARSCVSSPNGTADSYINSCGAKGGKPHDVEVRTALTLFHCILRKARMTKRERKAHKRKKRSTEDEKGGR